MKQRPLWLVILAVLHILEPFSKIIYFSIVTKTSPVDFILSQVNSGNPLHAAGFFLLFPFMGFAMLSLNKWVFVLLILSELWVVFGNLLMLPRLIDAGQTNQIVSLAIMTLINLAVVILLIIPISKLALTDPRIQWWKTFPRYRLKEPITIDDETEGKIHSISESGIFVASTSLEIEKLVKLKFSHDGKEYKIKGRVRSYIKKGKAEGCGIEYEDNSRDELQAIKNLVKTLKEQGAPRSAANKTVTIKFPGQASSEPKKDEMPTSFHESEEENTQITYKIK